MVSIKAEQSIVLGPQSIINAGIPLSQGQLNSIPKIPFTPARLMECGQSYILFLGVNQDKDGRPINLGYLYGMIHPEERRARPSFFPPVPFERSFACKEAASASSANVGFRWYLMKKELVSASRFKTFQNQLLLLKDDEYVEQLVVNLYAMLLVYKNRGERLFPDYWLRSNTGDVSVSLFDASINLCILRDDPSHRDPQIIVVPFIR